MSSSHSRAGQSAAGAVLGIGADTRDAEMPATEKDLAEDAPWKKIQQEHVHALVQRAPQVREQPHRQPATDLSDGLRHLALLEVLSQKKMHRKRNQRPTFRQMQLENVSVALEFLDRESIKLVSIGEGAGRPVALAGRGRRGFRASSPLPQPTPSRHPLKLRRCPGGPRGRPAACGPREQRLATQRSCGPLRPARRSPAGPRD